MTAPHYLSLAEIAQRIRNKQITPQEVVAHHLQRIEKLQPELNAFVHIDEEGARRQAHAAGEAVLRGDNIGPLHGVPITVKSCLDVIGWPCSAGSLLRKDHRPSADAALVRRLRAAGAVLVGNTATPEFLMAYETSNRITGKTSNPWNTDFSSGGSSGGEAAAIASGCSAGGVGRDGGGSIGVPGHCCGICIWPNSDNREGRRSRASARFHKDCPLWFERRSAAASRPAYGPAVLASSFV